MPAAARRWQVKLPVKSLRPRRNTSPRAPSSPSRGFRSGAACPARRRDKKGSCMFASHTAGAAEAHAHALRYRVTSLVRAAISSCRRSEVSSHASSGRQMSSSRRSAAKAAAAVPAGAPTSENSARGLSPRSEHAYSLPSTRCDAVDVEAAAPLAASAPSPTSQREGADVKTPGDDRPGGAARPPQIVFLPAGDGCLASSPGLSSPGVFASLRTAPSSDERMRSDRAPTAAPADAAERTRSRQHAGQQCSAVALRGDV